MDEQYTDIEVFEMDDEDYFLECEGHVSCCGMSIVFEFGDTVKPGLLKYLDDYISKKPQKWDPQERRYVTSDEPYSHLYEVTLTDYQMRSWAPELKKRGFELHRRWKNTNSGNYCNLLTLQTVVEDNPTPPPYVW